MIEALPCGSFTRRPNRAPPFSGSGGAIPPMMGVEYMPMFRFALIALATISVASCSRGGKKSGPAVAEGGGITVTADELKARLDEQSPFVRARYATLERKKEFLENLIRFELLAKEAEKNGGR